LVFLVPTIGIAGWQAPVLIDSGGYFERPEIEARNDSIYVICRSSFVRSLDGGLTWQDEHLFTEEGGLRDGESFKLEGDTITAFFGTNLPSGVVRMWLYFSSDFGLTWQGPRDTWAYSGYPNVTCCRSGTSLYQSANITNINEQGTVYFSKSDDFGVNWRAPRIIYWYDTPGAPYVCKYFGRVFIISDINYMQSIHLSTIQILYSVDEGENWVSLDSLTSVGTNFGVSAAASNNGHMAFIYHDWWPDDPGGEDSSRVYVSVSSDSGSTWSWPVDLSDTTFSNYKPRLAMNGDKIAVCWHSSRGFVMRRSDNMGTTWGSAEVVDSPATDGDLSWDSGKIHTTYFGLYERNGALLYRRWEPDEQSIVGGALPLAFSLLPNYPNPFNLQTTISFTLAAPSDAALDIFDILGRRVETLHKGNLEAGPYNITWDSKGIPSGVYFYRLRAGDTQRTRRMLLLK
jgi:hypothetical protein